MIYSFSCSEAAVTAPTNELLVRLIEILKASRASSIAISRNGKLRKPGVRRVQNTHNKQEAS